MGEFTKEKINERLNTLRGYLDNLKNNSESNPTLDDFKGLEVSEIENNLTKWELTDVQEKASTISALLSIDTELYSFLENVIDELTYKVDSILEEIKNQANRIQNEKLRLASNIEKYIKFYEEIKIYLFEQFQMDDKKREEIVEFILNSDLADEEKFELSYLIAENVSKVKSANISDETKEETIKVESETENIDDFNEELDEIIKISESQDETEETIISEETNPLKEKINTFDIDDERKEIMYDLIKRYGKKYLSFHDYSYDKMNFENWYEDEEVIYELLNKDKLDDEMFYTLVDNTLYLLKTGKTESEINKAKEMASELTQKFSLGFEIYSDKVDELLEDVINPLIMDIDNKNVDSQLTEFRIREIRNILESTKVDLNNYIFSDKEFVELETFLSDLEYELSSDKNIEEEYIENEGQAVKKLIFARDINNNPYVMKDIKKFTARNCMEALKALRLLKYEQKRTDKAKFGKFNSTNKKLEKVAYTKGFQVRLYYKDLPNDYVYVMLLNEIKSDNDSTKRNKVEQRVNLLSSANHMKADGSIDRGAVNEYDKLWELFGKTDEDSVRLQEELLDENAVWESELVSKLSNKIKNKSDSKTGGQR